MCVNEIISKFNSSPIIINEFPKGRTIWSAACSFISLGSSVRAQSKYIVRSDIKPKEEISR